MDLVDVPDAQAARVFAFGERFARAGVDDQVLVRCWRKVLGRRMWDDPAEPGHDRRFLVIGHGRPGREVDRQALAAAQRRWFGEVGPRDGVIVGGPVLAEDGAGGWAARGWSSWVTGPRWRPWWLARLLCRVGCMGAWRSTTGSSAAATRADEAAGALDAARRVPARGGVAASG
jgi:hypothetical protein